MPNGAETPSRPTRPTVDTSIVSPSIDAADQQRIRPVQRARQLHSGNHGEHESEQELHSGSPGEWVGEIANKQCKKAAGGLHKAGRAAVFSSSVAGSARSARAETS